MIYRNFLTPLIPIQINKFANAIPVELRVEKISLNENTETMEESFRHREHSESQICLVKKLQTTEGWSIRPTGSNLFCFLPLAFCEEKRLSQGFFQEQKYSMCNEQQSSSF